MFTDDELLPISALQHLVFAPGGPPWCIWKGFGSTTATPRRGESSTAGPMIRAGASRAPACGSPAACNSAPTNSASAARPTLSSCMSCPGNQLPRIVIVEYKRGRPKPDRNEEYRVQLLRPGPLPGRDARREHPRRRGSTSAGAKADRSALLDAALREKTIAAARALRELINSRVTPRAQMAKKCKFCSLADHCLPRVTGRTGARRSICENNSTGTLPSPAPKPIRESPLKPDASARPPCDRTTSAKTCNETASQHALRHHRRRLPGQGRAIDPGPP